MSPASRSCSYARVKRFSQSARSVHTTARRSKRESWSRARSSAPGTRRDSFCKMAASAKGRRPPRSPATKRGSQGISCRPEIAQSFLYDFRKRLLRQYLVNELDADGALTHGGRDALDAAGTHVSDGEDAGLVRLEEKRRAAQRP